MLKAVSIPPRFPDDVALLTDAFSAYARTSVVATNPVASIKLSAGTQYGCASDGLGCRTISLEAANQQAFDHVKSIVLRTPMETGVERVVSRKSLIQW